VHVVCLSEGVTFMFILNVVDAFIYMVSDNS
jgi:hypothetical protein